MEKIKVNFHLYKGFSVKEEQNLLIRFLKDYTIEDDKKLTSQELCIKFQSELEELFKFDKSLLNIIITEYRENDWWVFGEVAKEFDYDIFMAKAENVGYKRTKRGEKPMPNDLFDLEYAPNKLSLDELKKYYEDLISIITKSILNFKNEKKEIKIKWIAKKRSFKKEDDKTKKATIKKQITNLEKTYQIKLESIKLSNEKLEELKEELKEALKVYDIYYSRDKIKPEYFDRTDETLIK